MLKRRQREAIRIHTLNKGGVHLRKTGRLSKQNVFAQTSTQRTINEGRITSQTLGKFGFAGRDVSGTQLCGGGAFISIQSSLFILPPEHLTISPASRSLPGTT